MPDAAPVTSAVLPSRSPMLGRARKKVSPGRDRAKRWRWSGLATHLAEQNAAFRLGSWFGFHDFHHYGLGRNGEILHHGVGNVLDQRTFLIKRAALDGVDIDFRHGGLPLCASHPATMASEPDIGRRRRQKGRLAACS